MSPTRGPAAALGADATRPTPSRCGVSTILLTSYPRAPAKLWSSSPWRTNGSEAHGERRRVSLRRRPIIIIRTITFTLGVHLGRKFASSVVLTILAHVALPGSFSRSDSVSVPRLRTAIMYDTRSVIISIELFKSPPPPILTTGGHMGSCELGSTND